MERYHPEMVRLALSYVRERSVSMSSLGSDEDAGEASVDPGGFHPQGAGQRPGGWADPPRAWGDGPEQRLLATEARGLSLEAIGRLSRSQRAVITLRDIEGLTAQEACEVLDLSDANQRVLLHRARTKVRQVLEDYMDEAADA